MNERIIFEAALEITDVNARRAFLNKACQGDSDKRVRVDALLRSHETAGSFLDIPVVEQIHSHTAQPAANTIVGTPAGEDDDSDDSRIDVSFLQPSTRDGSIGTLAHYEILQVIGKGGFGIVFKAFDEKLHRLVAIKVMNPEMAATSPPRKRFLREARSAAAIRHENIVQVYSVEEQPLPYIVMEYIEGQTLQQKQDAHGPLDAVEVLSIGRQIASGLAAAHAQGLIHRDIKPGNILLEQGVEQKVKITDFGLARAADDATMTRTGVVSGTPMYMAPEQALGQTLDQRTDLFSLGSVLYQIACGRPPFRAATTIAVLRRVVEDTPRPMQDVLPEIPDWLVTIVNKLLAKKPEDRFQSATEVADLLARCQSELQQSGRVTCLQRSHLAPRDEPATAASPFPSRPQINQPASLSTAVQPSTMPQGSSRGAMTATLGNSESFSGPDRRWWRYFGFGTIVALVLWAAVRLNPRINEPAPEASGGHQRSEASGIYANESIDPDRRAARWVVSIGGTPRITEGDKEWEVGRLPDAPFELRGVTFHDNLKVTDAGLANFRGCQNLRYLRLHLTPVTDAGMEYFKDCRRLKSLDLGLIPVGDTGLAHLKDCEDLAYLSLDRIQFTEAGLAHFKECRELTELVLNGTGLTDAGLAHLRNCRNLTKLELTGREVTDAGMAHFKDCGSLKNLSLSCQNVTEAGLAHFKDCQQLTDLVLSGPTASDESLAQFENCKNLTYLTFMRTKVSDAGLERLASWPQLLSVTVLDSGISDAAAWNFAAALPSCSIKWNGGVIEPTTSTDPDRRAAEYVLSIGGTIGIRENGPEREIKAVGDLPRGAFELDVVNLDRNPKVSDAGLAHFEDCKSLTDLWLHNTQVSDAGLAYFKDCKSLTYLHLGRTKVSDAGLTHFKECENLTHLELNNSQVSDGGLTNFFESLKLVYVNVKSTKVTEAGVEKLSAALPGCKIEWDGGVIEPVTPQTANEQ